MKRPIVFNSLFWIPLVFAIVFFWKGHLTNSSVPLLERFSTIAPGAMLIFVLLLVAAGIWTAVLWFTHKEDRQLRLRPLTVFACWLLLVIAMGTISMGDIWDVGKAPITETVKEDIFLKEFGLTVSRDGPLPEVSAVNSIKMFGSLTGHVLTGIFALLLIVAAALGMGTWIRRMFPENLPSAEKLLLQLGAGFSAWIFLLCLLGLFGVLGVSLGSVPLMAILLAVFAIIGLLREGANLWKMLWQPCVLAWEKKDGYLQPFFVIGLMLVTAASFLHVMRPIPIGWDDIGVYMNVPSLTAEHGALVGGFGTYNWGLIMSLGFLVWKTPYIAMLFSFLGGILAFFGLSVVLKHLRGREKTSSVPLFLVTAFAMAPFVLFQLGEDMKIDLSLLFMGTVASLIGMLLWRHENLRRPSWYVLLGIIFGIALGIKMTALLLIVMILGLLLLRMVGGWGLTALLCWFLFVLFLGNIFSLSGLDVSGVTRTIFLIGTALGGLGASIITFMRSKAPAELIKFVAITVLSMLFAFSPWIIFNVRSWCVTTCPPLSITMLISSASSNPVLPPSPTTPAPVATASGSTMTGTTLQQQLEQTGGNSEELGRYAGYDQSLMHYLSLPFDSSFSINVSGDYVTVGWVFLGLMLLAAAWGVTQHTDKSEPVLMMTLYALVLLFLLVGSLWGGGATAPWALHALTIGVGLLLVLSIVYIAHHNHDAESFTEEVKQLLSRKKLTLLTQAPMTVHIAMLTVVYGFLWMYLASGVVWYGITGIIGVLLLGAAALEQMRAEERGKVPYTVFIVLLTLFWIVPMYAYKLTTSDTSIKKFTVEGTSLVSDFTAATSYDTRHFLLFKAGVLDQETGLKFFNGEYYAASQLLNQETTSKIYRIGTLLPYFIRSNDTRITTDNQLDQFVASYLPSADGKAFIQRLYDAGFRYIVFDLGTASIDKTAEQTLKKKVDLFETFSTNNPYLHEELHASGFIIWSLHPSNS